MISTNKNKTYKGFHNIGGFLRISSGTLKFVVSLDVKLIGSGPNLES